ncbi:MAG TPA: hypothetical protein VGL37_05025 [Solirubrobacteraceae bacterium]
MSKDNLIYICEQLTFRAIETTPDHFPAKAFINDLDDTGMRDFHVAARVLATSLGSGRPPSGRAERVAGTRCGLFELRITPPGRRGPHTRLLYVRKRSTIWCVRGLVKRERLHRTDIKLADGTVKAWRAGE